MVAPIFLRTNRYSEEEMDALENIYTRRSVRSYQDRPVPEELIEKLLAAAMQAPSARNQQPWHFVVLDDREVLSRVLSRNV
jgi:nitroreductase